MMAIFDSHWDRETIPYKNILLDGENPRIPSRFHGDYDAVFRFLLHNEDIVGLANSIIRAGSLYPCELIICLKESDDEYIVLEGNRRLAAVRILHDPGLLDVYGVRRSLLNDFDPSLVDNIKFLESSVVPSRAVAKPVIASIHLTGSGRHPWSDRRQITFAAVEAKRNVPYTEIANILMCSEAQAMEYVCYGKILDVLQGLKWTDAELDILDNDKLRLTKLFKTLTSSVAHRHFGQPIFMRDGNINRQLSDSEQIIKTIVEDALFWQAGKDPLFQLQENTKLAGYFKTRFPSSDERETSTLGLFSSLKLLEKKPQIPTLPQQQPGETTDNGQYSSSTPDKTWNQHEPRDFFEHLVYQGRDERTALLVRELSRLSSKTFENQKKGYSIFPLSASFLMRATIEWLLHHRISESGYLSDFNEAVRHGRPNMDHYLNFSVKKFRQLNIPKDIAQKIEMVRNDTALKNDLQWNVHNDRGNSSPTRISEIAKKIRPIVEHFLIQLD